MTKRYGFEFRRSTFLKVFRVLPFPETLKVEFDVQLQDMNGLKIIHLDAFTKDERPRELLIVASGNGRKILATVLTEHVISTWQQV